MQYFSHAFLFESLFYFACSSILTVMLDRSFYATWKPNLYHLLLHLHIGTQALCQNSSRFDKDCGSCPFPLCTFLSFLSPQPAAELQRSLSNLSYFVPSYWCHCLFKSVPVLANSCSFGMEGKVHASKAEQQPPTRLKPLVSKVTVCKHWESWSCFLRKLDRCSII